MLIGFYLENFASDFISANYRLNQLLGTWVIDFVGDDVIVSINVNYLNPPGLESMNGEICGTNIPKWGSWVEIQWPSERIKWMPLESGRWMDIVLSIPFCSQSKLKWSGSTFAFMANAINFTSSIVITVMIIIRHYLLKRWKDELSEFKSRHMILIPWSYGNDLSIHRKHQLQGGEGEQ